MADILIRGMEMPKTCQICRTAKFDRIVGCEEWDGLSIAQRMYMRRETCPLVHLPEGHGRCIDADALQEEFKKFHDGKRLMLIDTAPTIVPSEGSVNDGT